MSHNMPGVSAVAAHLGASITSVCNWAKKREPGFPLPVTTITTITGKVSARGWEESQLPELRAWYAQHKKIKDPDAYYAAIDEKLMPLREQAQAAKEAAATPAHIHPGQETIHIPAQRTQEAA